MLKKILIIPTLTFFVFICANVSAQERQPRLKDTITDRSIVVPPSIERNFDALLTEWNKNIKPSSVCNTNGDSDITYSEAEYIHRLYSFPSEMELTYNQIVRSYIDMYSGRRRNQVAYMLAEGDYYFPLFEHTLDKYGLPLELKYLPVIESALKPTAVSSAGATGLWQFMLGTGKMYDLEVNSLVDERRDPVKASDAAARYLKDLYNIYGDWNLVIAAYNCGPGNVNKAIRRSNGEKDYWAIYPYLPRETRGYVPAFIAATYIMSYYKDHNICPMEFNYPPSMDTLTVNTNVHFQQIADILQIPIEDIRTLNPQYKKDVVPGDYKPYVICLPSAKIADFITQKDAITSYKKDELFAHRKTVDMDAYDRSNTVSTRKIIHKVKKGETLNTIAKRYGVSTTQIKKWNRLKSNKLSAGRRLTINKEVYKKTPKKTETNSTQTNSNQLEASNYSTNNNNATNSSGDSDVIGNYLKKQLGSNSAEAEAEDEDEIDNSGEATDDTATLSTNYQEATKTIYHKVKIGETLTQIANRYGVTSANLTSWNKLRSKAVKVGQRLIIFVPEKMEKEILAARAANEKQEQAAEQAKKEIEERQIAKQNTKATQQKPPQKEAVKKETTKKKVAPKKVNYTVRKGDNLSIIANKYKGVSANDIMKANRLSSNKLKIGQKLVIPTK